MKKKLLFLFFNLFLVSIIFCFCYKKIISKFDKIDLDEIKNELNVVKNKNKELYDNYEKINNLYEIQKNEIEEIKISNFILKKQIENIKKETPEHIKIKTTALNLLTQIAILTNNNSDFITKIEELKILANNNSIIIECLEELKIFNINKINIDVIMKDFYLESNNNELFYNTVEFKNKNLNNIAKNIIKIKKIKKKENSEQIKAIIQTIQNNIENLNYMEAINIIKQNQLEAEFSKTVVNLENKIKFDLLIKKLIYLF